MEALSHQQPALDEIIARAQAYYAGEWIELPIKPRWATLMVGGTGSGKTTIALIAANALEASMLRISAPGWMPAGAINRGTRETISKIAEHVAYSKRTLLVVDEIDKLIDGTGDTSWKSYIRGELYDLLDMRWPLGMNMPDPPECDDPEITIEHLNRKLRETVFILGIGTFQSWFDGARERKSMGFGAETNPETQEISAEIVADKLPRELANRFNSKLIRLPELTADDYHRIARETELNLPLHMRENYRRVVALEIEDAIQNKKGVRFLEEVIMQVLRALAPPTKSSHDIIASQEIIEKPDIDLCIQ